MKFKALICYASCVAVLMVAIVAYEAVKWHSCSVFGAFCGAPTKLSR